MVAEATDILVEGSQRWSGDLIERITTRTASFIASLEWCIAQDDDPGRAYALFVPLFAPAQQKAADVQAMGSALFAAVAGHTGAPPRRGAGGERHRARPRLRPGCRRGAWPRPLSPILTARPSPPCWRSGRSPWPPSAGTTPRSALEHAQRGRAAAAAVPMPPFERELRGFEAALLDRGGDAIAAAALTAGGHRRLARRGRPAHRDLGTPGGGDHRHPRRAGGRRRDGSSTWRSGGPRGSTTCGGEVPSPARVPCSPPTCRPATVGERLVPCGAAPSSGALASATWASSPSPSPRRPRPPRRTATETTRLPCCERRRTCPPSPCCQRCTPTACAKCHRTTTARARWCLPFGRRSPS